MVFRLNNLILLSIFINKIITLDILKKYGSASVSSVIIFESKDFEVGDEMYFKVTSAGSGGIGNLHYQYYDDINSLDILSETKYKAEVLPGDETTSVLGVVVSRTGRFAIKKRKEEMEGCSGDYMLLDINGSGTIENTIVGLRTIIVILIAVSCGASGIAIIVIVIYFIYQKIKNKNSNNEVKDVVNVEENNNNSVYSKDQINPKSKQKTIIIQNNNNINNQVKNNLISQFSNENENVKKKYKKTKKKK